MQKLSIIVPMYKTEKYLRQCLDSLTAQTYSNLEIVLIDDGSPDQCGVIADQYAAKDPRIVVIHKSNGGLSSAWNCGLDSVTGDYLTFVDSDDWVDADYYERVLSLIGDQDYDVFMSNGRILELPDGSQREAHTFDVPFVMGEGRTKEDLLACTLAPTRAPSGELYCDLGFVWDKVYRTAFIQEHELRVTSSLVTKCAWVDALFVYQVINEAKTVCGERVTGYHYRIVDSSATQKYNPSLMVAYADFFDEMEKISGGVITSRAMRQAMHHRVLAGLADCARRSWFHPQNQDNKAELAEKIRNAKSQPCFYEAIYSQDNAGIQKKYVLLKYVMRLPFVWPLQLLERANRLKNNIVRGY